MKILRVIARLNIGGPARHVVVLDRGLRARGHQTLLVHGTVADGEASLEHLAADAKLPTLKVAELGPQVGPLSDLKALLQLLRTTFREAPDVVHTHTAKAGTLGRIAALAFNATRGRRRRCLVVHTFHGHVLEGYFNPALSRVVRGAERLLARATDRIVTISPSQRHDIVERFGVSRRNATVVVPLGLDLQPFLSGAGVRSLRGELGIDEHAIAFGYVGRLVPIKDVPMLVLAFAQVVESAAADAYLLIAGDGPVRPELERLIAQRGLDARVRLLGWREDLANIYATLDVCVLSSRNEGTPVAVIEAMAAGRPIVATRVGGVPDVVETARAGLLVPAGDVDALAAAMIQIASDRGLRERMGASGRAAAAARFGHERLVEEIEGLYSTALADKRGAHRPA